MVTVSPPNPESRQIAHYLADLDQRMRRVETGLRTVQLSNSSLESGGITMFDSSGNYRGTMGFQPDGTTTVTSQNPQPPPIPSAPQVTPAMGCLIVSHTGETQSGTGNPADFDHLRVYTADAGIPGVRTFRGTINPVPGEFIVSGLDYTSYLVDVTSVNMGGKESVPSPTILSSPLKVVGDDIIEGAVSDLALADNAVTEAKIAADAVTNTKIFAGAVGANEIAAGSVSATHVVSRSITADRLVALTLTANEIATNAITSAKINAGAVTAIKLEADLVIANRFIAGSTSGARVEMHPTSGLQAFNGAGVRTFLVEASTGNYFSVGQFATGFSGSRIIMNTGQAEPDTIRLYQTNNSYAIIFADPAGAGAGVFMRGSNPNAGKVGVYDGEGFTSWVNSGLNLSQSACSCTSGGTTVWGGAITLEAQDRWGSGDVTIRNRNFDGTINSARDLRFQGMGGSGELPALFSPAHDTQIIFTDTGILVQNSGSGTPAYKAITASAFTVSGQAAKKDIQAVVLNGTSTARAGIAEVVCKSWLYQGEWDGTGERPPPSTWTTPEVVRDEKGIAVLNDEGTTAYEDIEHTGSEIQAVKPHIGLIAEDVAPVFPELVTPTDTVQGGVILGTNDMIGIMWNALHDQVLISDSAARRLPNGVTGGSMYGTVIDTMAVPPNPPTAGALMYENGGSVYIVFSTGKRAKVA